MLEAAGGRTLALFTSRRATQEAADALAPELPYTLLLQGDLPKRRLLEEFAEDETSCLFATLGFWQGVDIPGRALSLVTLDRLPFPRPDDPLLQARRERAGGGAFSLVDLPRAATLLAQGSGRLIRTAEDRGVVAVLDSRLATACYRTVLLHPPAHAPHRRPTRRRDVPAPGAPGRRRLSIRSQTCGPASTSAKSKLSFPSPSACRAWRPDRSSGRRHPAQAVGVESRRPGRSSARHT